MDFLKGIGQGVLLILVVYCDLIKKVSRFGGFNRVRR